MRVGKDYYTYPELRRGDHELTLFPGTEDIRSLLSKKRVKMSGLLRKARGCSGPEKRMHDLKKLLKFFIMNRKRYISSGFANNFLEMVELTGQVKSINRPLVGSGSRSERIVTMF